MEGKQKYIKNEYRDAGGEKGSGERWREAVRGPVLREGLGQGAASMKSIPGQVNSKHKCPEIEPA